MIFTKWTLAHDRVAMFCALVITVAGMWAYWLLPQSEEPSFVWRTALVTTVFPGATPDRVEELVTSVIEARVQEIPEIETVHSRSTTGRSEVFVDIQERYADIQERYADMRPIWDDLRRKVESVEGDLPDGVIGPFVNDELSDVYGIVFALVAEGYSEAETVDIAEELRDRLLRLPDAAKVTIAGGQDRRIYVEFDQARLADLHLSPTLIHGLLAQRNIVTPGGVIRVGAEQLPIEPSGSFSSVEDLRRMVIRLPGSAELTTLGDVATVSEGTVDPPTPRVHYMGERALAIGVSLRDGGNVGTLGDQVLREIETFESQYPVGVDLFPVSFAPTDVRYQVRNFLSNLAQAIGIVMLVMVPVLGMRTGLIIGSMIPLSMLATFILMQLFGVEIHTISFAGLLIALGMLVDNIVVMVEAVVLGMREGKPAEEAALLAAEELTMPMFVSAATTAASFLPIYLAKSVTGEYTSALFSVVAMALLSSWVFSITLTPLLCVWFLPVPKPTAPNPRVERGFALYRVFLELVLEWRWTTIGLGTVALIVACWLGVVVVDQKFFPPSDKATLAVELELGPSATLDETERVVADVEAWLGQELQVNEHRPDGVVSWAAFVGRGALRDAQSYVPALPADRYAYLKVETTSRTIVDTLVPQIEAWLQATHPEVLADVHPLRIGPPAGQPVAVRLSAPTHDALMEKADVVRARLASIPGTRNVDDDWGRRTKKLEIHVDPARARMAGVTNADVAVSLQASVSGIEVAEFRDADEVIPIVLRSAVADKLDIGRIESLDVFDQMTGRSVPLKQVADVALVFEAPVVLRRDLEKTIEVYADVAPGFSAARVAAELQRWLGEESATWSPDIRWAVSGEADVAARSTASINAQIPIAAIVMTALLVFQFNSVRLVAINLLVLPYCLVGVTFGLLLTGSYYGFMTMLGVVSLFGIVLNNANILLDRIDVEIRVLGRPPAEAILEASERRLSPIVLTTATNVAGLIPLWLGGGPVFEPMAIALLFGLVFATTLTLALVPAMCAVAYGAGVAKPLPVGGEETFLRIPVVRPSDLMPMSLAETAIHHKLSAVPDDETHWDSAPGRPRHA